MTAAPHRSDATNPAQEDVGLTFRDAIGDWDHVASDCVIEGRDCTPPLVTIAVTTYRRSDLIVETMESLLALRFDRPVAIIVLDNDPASTGAAALLEHFPALAARNFRYYVNRENLGVFGNFNRCIALCGSEWLSILNDDDLLDPDYLPLMFAAIDRDPSIDGIVCSKRMFGGVAAAVGRSRLRALGDARGPALRRLLYMAASARDASFGLQGRLTLERVYLGRTTRRVPAGRMFWGAILGNGGGFLFRRAKAVEIGGFYNEEYPSADFWFFARFAKLGHLRRHRAVAASIRETEGSISANTILDQIQKGFWLQRRLAGSEAPRWYRRFLPMMMEQYRVDFSRVWGTEVSRADVEAATGLRLPRHNLRRYVWTRFILGGL